MGLQLLEYLLKHGSDEVVRECHDRVYTIRGLGSFQHTDKEGRDRGKGVRDLSKIVCGLLSNRDQLAAARLEAKKTKKKLGNISATGFGAGSMSGFGGGGGGGGGSGYGGYGGDDSFK